MGLGSAHQTITTGANFIPELWSKEVQRATEANLVTARLVKRFDSEVASKGDTLHVPLVSNISATAKTASTQVTFSAPTENVVDITIDKEYESSFLIEDRLNAQAAYRLAEEYKDKAAYALAKQLDTDILGLYTNITQTQGTLGQIPNDDNFLRAIQYLDDADAPFKDRAFIMSPSTKKDFLKIDKYIDQDYVGMGDIPVKTGLFGQRYGIPFYVSTNVPTSTGHPVNQLIHKEAYAAAVQTNIVLKTGYIIEYTSQAYVTKILYGVKTYRATFGCLVYGAA